MRLFHKLSYITLFCLALCSCGQREGLAPVVEPNWLEANSQAKQHVVKRGETLYAIAFRYDQDYRQLAALNHLAPPYTVRVGQIVQLHSAAATVKIYKIHETLRKTHELHSAPHQTFNYQKPSTSSYEPTRWMWPLRGRIITYYSPFQGRKGVNIAGKRGERIRAANNGVVAYAGSGLSGYGNLIIIKHDNQYLTAYGNNSRNLVREGDYIKKGQVIAEIGLIDRHYWGVHFEIRKTGKPVNPLNYLQKS